MGVYQRRRRNSLAATVLASCVAFNATDGFAEQPDGQLSVRSSQAGVIQLSGIISGDADRTLRAALDQFGGIETIVLNSDGGSVVGGLKIAKIVRDEGLKTSVPQNAQCLSACSFILMAGAERDVVGQLGVHQVASDYPDLRTAQQLLALILREVSASGISSVVAEIMLATPPDEMYFFNRKELLDYGIITGHGSPEFDVASADYDIPPYNLSLRPRPFPQTEFRLEADFNIEGEQAQSLLKGSIRAERAGTAFRFEIVLSQFDFFVFADGNWQLAGHVSKELPLMSWSVDENNKLLEFSLPWVDANGIDIDTMWLATTGVVGLQNHFLSRADSLSLGSSILLPHEEYLDIVNSLASDELLFDDMRRVAVKSGLSDADYQDFMRQTLRSLAGSQRTGDVNVEYIGRYRDGIHAGFSGVLQYQVDGDGIGTTAYDGTIDLEKAFFSRLKLVLTASRQGRTNSIEYRYNMNSR